MNDTVGSKAQRVAEAAKLRAKVEAEHERQLPTGNEPPEEYRENMKAAAEEAASVKVQPRVGTITGEIDVEAMGDVKGDGRDAKDYPDNDPDKALGVPTYVHGLHETSVGGTTTQDKLFADRGVSEKTKAEMSRGEDAISHRAEQRTAAKKSTTRTVVTDADSDPDGEAGRKAAEEAKRRVSEEGKKPSK